MQKRIYGNKKIVSENKLHVEYYAHLINTWKLIDNVHVI